MVSLRDKVDELLFEFEVAETPVQRNKLRTLIISVIEEMVKSNELSEETLDKMKTILAFE